MPNNSVQKNLVQKKTIRLDMILLVLYVAGYFNYRDSGKCIIFMNKEVCVYDLMLAAGIGVFVMGYVLEANEFTDDPLKTELGICPGCDYWSILHCSLYFMLGCMFPNKYLAFFIFGVLWELFETYNGSHNMKFFGMTLNKDTDGTENWWYGRTLDISVNMFGYILGNYYINGNFNIQSLKNEFIF